MYLTWLDSNSWLIEMANQRILLDPWLVGPLVFGNLPWLFKGERRTPRPIPENIDLILLSQGLEDHAHPQTLEKLDRQIPVVGSPGAAKVAQRLGYTCVTALDHGKTYSLAQEIEIQAFPGSPIGPQTVENAYLLRDLVSQHSLYYEPHGYHSPRLKAIAPVDVVITPLVNLKLPLLGDFIKGGKNALEVVEWLQPQVILPTTAGGEVDFQGVLMSLLSASGGVAEFRQLLAQKQLPTQVLDPQPGDRLEVPLNAGSEAAA